MVIDIISEKFSEWIKGKNELEARISIFQKIRDIQYALTTETIDPRRYLEIFKINRGSCITKHLALADLLERLGLVVFYLVWRFRWQDLPIEWLPELKELVIKMPVTTHLALEVEIEGKWVLVDATLDPGLKSLGLPINDWDGKSNTLLPIQPLGEEERFTPEDRKLIRWPLNLSQNSLTFFQKLNLWLEELRKEGK